MDEGLPAGKQVCCWVCPRGLAYLGLAEEAELIACEFALAQVSLRATVWWALWEQLGRNGFVPGLTQMRQCARGTCDCCLSCALERAAPAVPSSSGVSGCVTWLPVSLGAQGDLCCLQVFHSKKIPFLGTCIGTFKMDVVTVYSQPGMTDCTAYLPPDPGFV